MSSRVFGPNHTRTMTPMTLRQVPRNGEAAVVQTLAEQHEQFTEQIAQLEKQHEQSRREAHAAGVREGEAAGRAQAAKEIQAAIERLARTIEELSQLRAVLRKEAEADMVKLSLAIARRVLRRELAMDPEALHGLVVAALERLQAQELCRVKVHPSQAALIQACLQKTVAGGSIEVLADGSREVGTVIFETQRGNLDVSVDTQLKEIERGLADCLRRRP